MSLIPWLNIVLLVPVLVLLLLLFVKKQKTSIKKIKGAQPAVSIIVAVRNEQENLKNLFQSLDLINYPREKLEIFFGDDDSSDSSLQLLKDYSNTRNKTSGNNNLTQVIEIKPTAIQEAKANVLMQLCEKASGEYFLFIDADIIPHPDLINNYLTHFKKGMGGITGVTLPQTNTLFHKMQEVDWCLALGMGSDAQTLGQDVTAMGNNMFVSRKAYEGVGGYRKLPKSLVEDFTLYKHIRAKGLEFPIFFDNDLLVKTNPVKGLLNLLKQRKRWMKGGLQLAWFMKSILLLQGIFYPLAIILLFLTPLTIIGIWSAKLILQSLYVAKQYRHLKISPPWFSLVVYEFYNCIFTILLMIYYLLPIKVRWKNREYGHN